MGKIYILLSIVLLTTVQARSQSRPIDPEVKLVKFYPNPATYEIHFDLTSSPEKSLTFQIYNFLGKKIYEIKPVAQQTVINLSNYYRGFYTFQIIDDKGNMIDSGRFQVSK